MKDNEDAPFTAVQDKRKKLLPEFFQFRGFV